MKKILTLMAVVFILALAPGFVFQAHAQDEATEQLKALQVENAGADAKAAFAAGDTRFLGVMGVTVEVPGIDPSLWINLKIRVLPGTTATVDSDEQIELNKKARDYCRIYNLTMMGLKEGR